MLNLLVITWLLMSNTFLVFIFDKCCIIVFLLDKNKLAQPGVAPSDPAEGGLGSKSPHTFLVQWSQSRLLRHCVASVLMNESPIKQSSDRSIDRSQLASSQFNNLIEVNILSTERNSITITAP